MAMSRPLMVDDDGTGTTGTVLNNAWYQAFCDAIDALAANPTSPFRIAASPPIIDLNDMAATAGSRGFRLINTTGSTLIYSINENTGAVAGAANLTLDRLGNVKVGADIYEKGRTAPMGHWVDVPYSAGNYTSDVGSWTVDAGDVITHSYTVFGKTLLLMLYLNTFSISGSPASLRLALPSPYSLAKGFNGILGNSTDGLVNVSNTTATQLAFSKLAGGTFSNVTNSGFLAGLFGFAVT
jgi:hypothetical protein